MPNPTPLQQIRCLRLLRALGGQATGHELAARIEEVDAWTQANASDVVNAELGADRKQRFWPAASELPHGEWALGYIELGVRCGRAYGGHPVKIERVGRAQTERMERETGAAGEARLASFYFGMISSMQAALDAESVSCGRLLGTYEVFDMEGVRVSQVSLVTMRFARQMMVVFSRIFPETTVKVAIINLPWALQLPCATVLEVLPARVKARVHILGAEWESVLANDLDAEALRLLRAGPTELVRHRGQRMLVT
jgi:hypothetical protein